VPCAVIFAEGVYLLIDQTPTDLATALVQAPGLTRLQTTAGKEVWVNPSNVLYIEDREPGGRSSRA